MTRTAAIVCGAGVSSTFLARAVRTLQREKLPRRAVGCGTWKPLALSQQQRKKAPSNLFRALTFRRKGKALVRKRGGG